MDDVASTSHSTLDPVSFKLSPDLTEAERGELAVEVQFYGLLRLMMPTEVPYYVQERLGAALLQGACEGIALLNDAHDARNVRKLQSFVAMGRAVVFEMGSATPWLTEEFQDLRYLITARVVNGSPLWAAEGGEWFMFRADDGTMVIGDESHCSAGIAVGWVLNIVESPDVLAPTQLLSNKWMSNKRATLRPQFTTAPQKYDSVVGAPAVWVDVPDMCVTAMHGLDDAEPAMAAALRQLAALTAAE